MLPAQSKQKDVFFTTLLRKNPANPANPAPR
jgi:hypothetical protein